MRTRIGRSQASSIGEVVSKRHVDEERSARCNLRCLAPYYTQELTARGFARTEGRANEFVRFTDRSGRNVPARGRRDGSRRTAATAREPSHRPPRRRPQPAGPAEGAARRTREQAAYLSTT